MKFDEKDIFVEKEVILEKQGNLGIIRLNRPKRLNTITKNVVDLVREYLEKLERNKEILAVLFEGSGEKAFCAGGDLLSILELFKEKGEKEATDVFAGGYANCFKISKFSKPIISFMNGIIMGGGVGISRNSDIRIATERTKWAMPETKIGLFPDVAMGYYLSRMKASMGIYLGMTGKIIDGQDCVYSNLATIKISSGLYSKLKEEIVNFLGKSEVRKLDKNQLVKKLKKLSEKYSIPYSKCFLERNKKDIDRFFSKSSVEEIIKGLEKEKDNSVFAKMTLEDMKDNSPLSMKIAFEEMKRMKNYKLAEGYKLDLSLVKEIFKGKNIFEGIRAVVIDKTRDANWEEPTIFDVSDEAVNRYFRPFDKSQKNQFCKHL